MDKSLRLTVLRSFPHRSVEDAYRDCTPVAHSSDQIIAQIASFPVLLFLVPWSCLRLLYQNQSTCKPLSQMFYGEGRLNQLLPEETLRSGPLGWESETITVHGAYSDRDPIDVSYDTRVTSQLLLRPFFYWW